MVEQLTDRKIVEYQVNSWENINGSIKVKVDEIAWAGMMIFSEQWNFK